MFQDKTLNCRDCGSDFEFTASEQEFYAEKGFTNEPGRCPSCRAARKQNGGGNRSRGGFGGGHREMFSAVCAECGSETQVPFQPSGERPVYCRDCFSSKKSRY
jgi:CxxC-x17-CxxC domain-containing protein